MIFPMKRILLFLVALCLASPALADQPTAGSLAGALPYHYLSGASTNGTTVVARPGNVYSIVAVNTTTTLYYLKFYDTSSTPTCNSSTVVQTYAIPFGASSAGGGFALSLPVGMRFDNGISFCITGGIADNDNTNAAAGVSLSLTYR
jgi:hypothetical protein